MNKAQTVEAQMLIRKPASIVFNAFIDPNITSCFWFTKSSGRLESGKSVSWEWEMYGASAQVQVKEVIPDKMILIEWGKPSTSVKFEFKDVSGKFTYVTIKHYGFQQTGDELIAAMTDSMGGFTSVLAGLKSYLEHGVKLNLVADKYPKEVQGN